MVAIILVLFALLAGVSLGVPSLRPTWKGTTTPVGPVAIVGMVVALVTFAAAIGTRSKLFLAGPVIGWCLVTYGFARDTRADLRRLGFLALFGAALFFGLLVSFRLV